MILANIADAENATGRSEPALAAYRRLAAVAEKLAAAEPADTAVRMKLHHALSRIGELLMASGRPSEAVAPLQRLLTLSEQYAAAEPTASLWRRQIVIVLAQLARAGDEPRARFGRALEIAKQLAAAGELEPSQADWVERLEKALAELPS